MSEPSAFDADWASRYRDVVNADATLGVIGRHCAVTFLLEMGESAYIVEMRSGRIEAMTPIAQAFDLNWEFAIRAPAESWAKFIREVPPPMYTDVIFMSFNGLAELEGNLLRFWQNIRALLHMLDLMRVVEAEAVPA